MFLLFFNFLLPNSIEKQIDLKCDGMEWDGKGTILKNTVNGLVLSGWDGTYISEDIDSEV